MRTVSVVENTAFNSSFNRFFNGVVKTALPNHWADDFYTILHERALTDVEKTADSIRYRVTKTGVPFSQVCVPVKERTNFAGTSELIWALLSPERSVLDAIRLRDAIFSIRSSDDVIENLLSYFGFLEKYGYLEKVK